MQGSYEKTGNTVLDPVCGMYVVPEKAAGHLRHDGRDYYFCSKHCEQKFSSNPEEYLRAKPGNLVQLGTIATAKNNGPQQTSTTSSGSRKATLKAVRYI